MFLKSWKGLAALALVVALAISGAGIYAAAAGEDVSTEAGPKVEVCEEGTDSLTVLVGARVEGQIVPMSGVDLEVFSVDIERTNESLTITLEKVTAGETDDRGKAFFELAHGRYLVVAHYNGLKAMGKYNLTGDSTVRMLLHNWHRGLPGGIDKTQKITITAEF